MSIQTTIPFNIRKKFSFYGSKENTPKQECFTNVSLRSTPNTTYTPTTKKLMVLSSSDSESDSDSENVEKKCAEAKFVPNSRTPKSSRISRINGEFTFAFILLFSIAIEYDNFLIHLYEFYFDYFILQLNELLLMCLFCSKRLNLSL